MTSAVKPPNLPVADPSDKEHYQLGTSRAHPAVRKLIDRAALELDENRGEFLLQAGVERAVRVLGSEQAGKILEAA